MTGCMFRRYGQLDTSGKNSDISLRTTTYRLKENCSIDYMHGSNSIVTHYKLKGDVRIPKPNVSSHEVINSCCRRFGSIYRCNDRICLRSGCRCSDGSLAINRDGSYIHLSYQRFDWSLVHSTEQSCNGSAFATVIGRSHNKIIGQSEMQTRYDSRYEQFEICLNTIQQKMRLIVAEQRQTDRRTEGHKDRRTDGHTYRHTYI